MKYLLIILIAFALSCKLVIPTQNAITWEQWADYEKECYNDSTMVVVARNNGTVSENSIVFEKDTIWTHKQSDIKEFIKKAK